MPIYEYQCKKCEKHFEKRQAVQDEPLTVCEECGGELEKKWSLSGFQFKGAGWYVTDYSAKNKPNTETGASGEKSSGAESTAKTDTASNSKSEAVPAPKVDLGKKKD